ncbi:unnamed protein product [Ectocarpus sp. 12 AP-2014]
MSAFFLMGLTTFPVGGWFGLGGTQSCLRVCRSIIVRLSCASPPRIYAQFVPSTICTIFLVLAQSLSFIVCPFSLDVHPNSSRITRHTSKMSKWSVDVIDNGGR